ncbi:related to YMC2 |nr:related to YMC2 \
MYTSSFTPNWGGTHLLSLHLPFTCTSASTIPSLTHTTLNPPPNPSTPLAHPTLPRSSSSSNSSPSKPSTSPSETGASIKGFVGGTVSGLTKLLVGHPFDTIKVRMQCSPHGTYTGPLDCFLQLARRESLLGLYKGATPPALGWAITDSVLLGSLHNYRRMFARLTNSGEEEDGKGLAIQYHALAGLMAGWTNSFVTTPVELIKAKLQMQTQRVSLHLPGQSSLTTTTVTQRTFTGPIDCIRQTTSQHGIFGLWHALPATLLFRSSFAAMFGSYEYFQRLFNSWKGTRWELNPGTITFVSGGLGAEVFWLTAFPADVIKNRMMADNITNPKYKDIKSAWVSVWNQRGKEVRWWCKVSGVYTGFLPCLLRAFPTNAAALFAFETAMRFMGAEKV